MKLRAVILDDEPLARARLRSLLEPDRDVEVVGDAGRAVEALRLVAEFAPDSCLSTFGCRKSRGSNLFGCSTLFGGRS
ncbi:MAG TPA: hypothetical protein VF846_06755 [Thermoanaerobaculia bacterium]|jgi:DNA-binding NarL/FixJ family response regulator